MTLWSSPHPKESAALSLGQAQQGAEAGKIKELGNPGTSMPTMPSSVTSFSSDGSEDVGFEDGSIDVEMGEEEQEGLQIDCIQTLTELEPADLPGTGTDDSPVMADDKTAIPLPAPPVHVGSAYGGNQAYGSLQNTLPPMIDRPTSPMQYWENNVSADPRNPCRAPGDIGLNNIGNTCFMNSGLQCLLHTCRLVEYFLESDSFDRTATSLVYQFHTLMTHAWFGYAGAIALHDFKTVLGNKYSQFKDCRQHDCQEFLAVLLDQLHEELKLKNKTAAADSSVGESYIMDCTSNKPVVKSTTNKPHSSSSQRYIKDKENNSNDGEESLPGKNVLFNPVIKRLRLENNSKGGVESTSNEADAETAECDVKRKTVTIKQENTTADSEAEDVHVDVENTDNENEAEVCNNLDENSIPVQDDTNPVEKARNYWDGYMKENNTVIASTFQGMFKSSVVCSECSFVSETYEPFMYLSLPIPRVMEKQLTVTFFSLKNRKEEKINLTIYLMANVGKLIQDVVCKVESCSFNDQSKFAAAEVANHRVFRVLDESLQVRTLGINSKNIYVFELNDNFDEKYGFRDSPASPDLSRRTDPNCPKVEVQEDYEVNPLCTPSASDVATSSSNIRAPVGGGIYNVAETSSSFSQGVCSSSVDDQNAHDDQENDNFNRVQCNICLEDYPRNDLKQHKGCSCVLCQECLMKSVEHFQSDDDKPKGGSYVKCAVCLKTVECKRAFVSLEESAAYIAPPEFIIIPIIFRHEPGADPNNNSSWNSGLFHFPWLVRVPSHLSAFELVEYLESICPIPGEEYRLLSVKFDGRSCGQCVFSARCNGCELPRDGMISLNSGNCIMISFTGLSSEQLAEKQPSDMATVQEPNYAWSYNNNEEPAIDIHDCLRTFSETEHLDEQNPWYCPRCKQFQRATKALSICKFPDYLIVYLKRFVFLDQSSNKLNNRLTFPINDLDVSAYVTEGFATDVGKYNLYSCVCHFGSASVGHYTAFAKNPVTNQWHNFNDDTVLEREPADTEHASAYVLFYHKQGLTCNIPTKFNKPLPEINSFNTTLSSSYNVADTRGSYLPTESPIGPVRIDGDFINDMNLQVDSTSPSFTYPHTSSEQDLLALEADEGVGSETNQLLEIRDGLGLTDNDSGAVTSSTSAPGEDADLDFDNLGNGDSISGSGVVEEASSSSPNPNPSDPQNEQCSSSSGAGSTGGADSTSN